MKFEDFKFSDQLKASIKRMGFEEPTLIQAKSIQHIVEGKDVIGESATGSGKTLAFGCGIIENTVPGKGIQALVLAPTRELAEQVKNFLIKMDYKRLRIISIYGGVAIGPQIDDLSRADVVVATPGRFLDHLGRGTMDTSKIQVLVLDEADRMFDMGFIDDVKEIIKSCRNRKQTLFFSATISYEVKDLAKVFMKDFVIVTAEKMVDPSKLKQVYYDTTRQLKLSLLIHLLQSEKSRLIMVFCNSRRSVDYVVKGLKVNNVNSIAIHGGYSQNKRTKTMETFNKGKAYVLVCTDVAARGLHIDNVSHVYNYDIPNDPTDYVHRIGRTARAGEAGKVVNLLTQADYDNFSRLLNTYRDFTIDCVEAPYVKRAVIPSEDSRRRGSFRGNDFRGSGGSQRGRGPSRGPARRGPQRRNSSQRNQGHGSQRDSRPRSYT